MNGSGLSPLYAVLLCLALVAAWGWPYVVVYCLIAGPLLGAHHALSANKEKVESE